MGHYSIFTQTVLLSHMHTGLNFHAMTISCSIQQKKIIHSILKSELINQGTVLYLGSYAVSLRGNSWEGLSISTILQWMPGHRVLWSAFVSWISLPAKWGERGKGDLPSVLLQETYYSQTIYHKHHSNCFMKVSNNFMKIKSVET